MLIINAVHVKHLRKFQSVMVMFVISQKGPITNNDQCCNLRKYYTKVITISLLLT